MAVAVRQHGRTACQTRRRSPPAALKDERLLLQGRRLLALTQADLYQLVDTKLDADLLMDAIHDLRLRAVS